MSGHEQFGEDLALYALGTLAGEERAALEKHLSECNGCRRELEQLRGDMGLMALSASGPRPPQRARQRLMSAITQERRPLHVPKQPKRTWWRTLEWVAAAAALAIVMLLVRQNSELQKRVASAQESLGAQQGELIRAREIADLFTAPETQRVTLVAAKTPPQPQGKTFYLRNRGQLIFLANNLPALPPQKIYELWLIPTTGAPVPAGLFKPDAHGSATIVNPPLPSGVEAKTFAVTLESESGPHDAPHGQAVMAGAGE
jgi:anti-sigma-K factor RskA